MSDNDADKPMLTRKPLGLKRTVEAGQVQQQFSHGRKNTVVVEVKRRRILGKPGEEAVAEAPAPVVEAPPPKPVAQPKPARPRKASRAAEVAPAKTKRRRAPSIAGCRCIGGAACPRICWLG